MPHALSFDLKQPNLGLAQLLPQLHVCVTLPPSLPLLFLLCCLCMPSFCCGSAKERNLKKKKKKGEGLEKEQKLFTEAWDGKAYGFFVYKPSCESDGLFFPPLSFFLPYFLILLFTLALHLHTFILCLQYLCLHCCVIPAFVFCMRTTTFPPYHNAGCWCCAIMLE